MDKRILFLPKIIPPVKRWTDRVIFLKQLREIIRIQYPAKLRNRMQLTGDRMKEIQAVNAERKEAIAGGMTMEEAIKKFAGR